MNIRLKAQLCVEDYIAAQHLHLGRVPQLICTSLILGGGMIGFWLGGEGISYSPVVLAVMVPLFGVFLWIALTSFPKGIAKRTAKTFRQQKSLQLPYDVEINETQMTTSSENRGEWKALWVDFYKWNANDKLILIYASDRIFHMFPRRWFASDNEFQGFKDLLSRTIGPMKKARK